MDRIPEIDELHDQERLVIEFDDVSCLGGPSRWVMEVGGDDSSSLRIRTIGRMVIPSEETFRLDGERKQQMNDLLRNLPSYVPGGTSHSNFVVWLQGGGRQVAKWEFHGVAPPSTELCQSYLGLLALCREVPHVYRKPNLGEHTKSVLLMVPIALVAILGLLVWAVWSPFGFVYRLIKR